MPKSTLDWEFKANECTCFLHPPCSYCIGLSEEEIDNVYNPPEERGKDIEDFRARFRGDREEPEQAPDDDWIGEPPFTAGRFIGEWDAPEPLSERFEARPFEEDGDLKGVYGAISEGFVDTMARAFRSSGESRPLKGGGVPPLPILEWKRLEEGRLPPDTGGILGALGATLGVKPDEDGNLVITWDPAAEDWSGKV